MITFFRQFRQRLLTENKYSKYLLYAIGEIILVVIGILIALQVNNANENRKQNERSRIFLLKLKTQLDKNKITAENYLEDNELYLSMSKRLLKKADNRDATLSAQQLDTLIFINALDFFINLEMVVLEEGKGNGNLSLVQPDSLRQSLYRFIKEYDIYKEREKVINEDLSINFKPYLNKHYNIRNLALAAGFDDLGLSPLSDYKAVEIVQDLLFENHITTRILLQEDMVNSTQELTDVITVASNILNTVLYTINKP